MQIVLVEPEIPSNTGNIARTCAATGCSLHLVRPLGFSTDNKMLKRAGLDYWDLLDVHYYDSLAHLWDEHRHGRFWYLSTRGRNNYAQAKYAADDWLVFGKETKGLPQQVIDAHPEQTVRIPIRSQARSLNLSNAVAIVVFEALRQIDFPRLV